jgi:hypothetical protein
MEVLNVRPARDIFAQEDEFWVSLHFLPHCFVQRLSKVELSLSHLPLLSRLPAWGLGVGGWELEGFFTSP